MSAVSAPAATKIWEQNATPRHRIQWCPGCGDFGVLAGLKMALTKLELLPHNVLPVGGIGCSGQIRNYLNGNGFHGTHGGPLAYALGAKMANPDLTVITLVGDGDTLAIGMENSIHACRRDPVVALFSRATIHRTRPRRGRCWTTATGGAGCRWGSSTARRGAGRTTGGFPPGKRSWPGSTRSRCSDCSGRAPAAAGPAGRLSGRQHAGCFSAHPQRSARRVSATVAPGIAQRPSRPARLSAPTDLPRRAPSAAPSRSATWAGSPGTQRAWGPCTAPGAPGSGRPDRPPLSARPAAAPRTPLAPRPCGHRDPDHRRLLHRGVREEHLLDLPRVDVEPA